ncbi:myeloid leukemia factor 1-like isoform X2 [Polyodon spathula]|nr:myeloid leukemia factor 1-like isoform X2 [Polyodon spathula]
MFNSFHREFDEDPFFADSFRAHHQMMMRSFSDPFGRDPFLSIADGRERARDQRGSSDSNVALREDRRAPDGRSPFSMVDSMMANMRNTIRDMHRNFDNLSLDSNAHSFSSSSVMTYSKVGDGHAKVFQASSQTRRVPGGIKETKRSLKDSESGVEKMAIGHHIHDRAHVIAQSQNRKTGDRERNEEFLNLDETEAQSFEEEWQRGVSKFKPSVPLSHLEAPKHRTVHRAAIAKPDDAARREKHLPKAPEEVKKIHFKELSVKGSGLKNNHQ